MAQLLNQRLAAEQLGLSTRSMERLRETGGGPKYAKIGARVLYPQAELDAWVARQLCDNTSQRRADNER